jgi:F-type H+-transporting ATPase subunit a
MIAMLIADLIVLVIAWIVRRAATSGQMVPTGFSGAMEALLEAIYNLTESTAGRWAKQIFPWFATITIYVLIANWMELIPGVDSIGLIEHAEGGAGHAVGTVLPGIITLLPGKGDFTLVSFVRVLSTDLNFTVALALIVVFMTQVMGVRALGPSYFTKFINVKTVSCRSPSVSSVIYSQVLCFYL